MERECEVCRRLERARQNENPYHVAQLQTGHVVLGDHQGFLGYTLFLNEGHTEELHQMARRWRELHLAELGQVAEAVHRAFRPQKLNIACLGNRDHHVHWHIFPRHVGDPNPLVTVWEIPRELWQAERHRPSADLLDDLKRRLLAALRETLVLS